MRCPERENEELAGWRGDRIQGAMVQL